MPKASIRASAGSSISDSVYPCIGESLVTVSSTSDSPMKGYTLSEIELPADARILAFGKADGHLSIPDPDLSMEVGDRVVVIADFSVLRDVRQIIVGEQHTAAATGGA